MNVFQLPHHHGDEENLACTAEQVGKVDNFRTVSEIFKQLSDSSRMRIFWMLCHCEACVINIAAVMDMTPPAVSHHLKQLKYSGLIVSRREGKEVYYKAADTPQGRLLHRSIEQMMEITCPKTSE